MGIPSCVRPRKVTRRLERLRDAVVLRFGGTGVWRAVQAAVDLRRPAVAFPVRSLTTFATEVVGGGPPMSPQRPRATLIAFAHIELCRTFGLGCL